MSLERFHSAFGHLSATRVGALCLLLAFPSALHAAGDSGAGSKSAPVATQASQAQVVAAYGKLPLSFEVNQGQTDARVKFLSRGRGYGLSLTPDEAVLTLRQPSAVSGQPSAKRESHIQNLKSRSNSRIPNPESRTPAVLRLKLVGANPSAKVTGLEELPGKSNYFIGKDPNNWRTNVPTYAKVAYKNVYPGIDLVYYGKQRQLEYDFVVAPGADPKAIRFAVETGNSKLEKRNSKSEDVQPFSPSPASVHVDSNGDLVIAADGGEIRFRKPVVYQIKSAVGSQQSAVALNHQSAIDNRQFLDGRYVLLAENRIGFEVADYDKSKPLIIDPVLSYSTYLGGSDVDEAAAIAVDGYGNAYLIGDTTSGDFPTWNPEQPANAGLSDVFVTKIDAAGSALLYSTYLGGTADDTAYQYGGGIAVDAAGNAYLTGGTSSSDFPTTVGAVGPFQGSLGGGFDAFVAKLGPTGSVLVYSTYLGGSAFDYGGGIAIDSSGGAYVAGQTYSSDFPLSNALQPSFGGSSDAFVARLNATGTALNYSTYLGGSADDFAFGIAVDSGGNAYVAGRTLSSDFPTVNAFRRTFGGLGEAFVTKVAAGGASLLYSSFLGGSALEGAIGIAADSSGNAYVTGWTYSSDFPTVGALQQALAGSSDAFITKVNPTGSGLVYSTFLGGTDNDLGYGIAVDSSGNAYVTGNTSSTGFPTASPLQDTNAGAEDAFVAKVTSAGSALIFSTYLGGSGSDNGTAIAVDSSGDAYVAGATASTDFPTTSSAYDRTCGTDGNCNAGAAPATSDAFVAKLTGLALPVVTLSPTHLDFGSLGVGFTSAPQTVTLTNNGDAVLNITSIVASGDFAQTNDCGASRGAGASCTITVTFTPTATGSRTGAITITDDAPGSPHVVSLVGDGLPAPAITLSATSLDFGSQLLGTYGPWVSSPANTVTVTNTGTAPLIISDISISSATGDFTIALPNTAGPTACQLLMAPDITLAVNESCRIPVVFLPTIVGTETGQITITHNAPGSPRVVSLSGTGVTSITGPAVTLSPASLSFPDQKVATPSSPQTVTLMNSGVLPLTISNIVTSADYTQTNTCPIPSATLAPQASCSISVKFTPTVGGSDPGTLTITDNAADSPQQVVTLSGAGISPVPQISQPLVPAAAGPGAPGFTLTVNGTGFVSGSVVKWNGSARPTTFVSGTQLTATIPAPDIATVGTAWVTVVNPTPGGGTSNVLFFQITNPVASLQLSKIDVATGGGPRWVITADFNGDGKHDLAVADQFDPTVSILLGNGNGTFQPRVAYATGGNPKCVTAGDFNGDGILDLALSNSSSNSVSVLLGNGDGTFQTQVQYATGSSPETVAAADFNADGQLDLVTSNGDSQSISVLLGNGDGTFQSRVDFGTAAGAFSATPGDFNQDGKLDLAVGTNFGSTVAVLLGNGDGTFQSPVNYAAGSGAGVMAVADLNGDGKLDLAVVNIWVNTLSVLLGNGDGTFQTHVDYGTGSVPKSVIAGDLDGDGKLDLAVANDSSGTASVYLGNGDGTFQPRTDYPTGVNSKSVTTGDFNRDGRLDLAVVNAQSNNVSVLLQGPALTLSPTSLNFADQAVGITSTPQTVTLTNNGSAPLTISSIVASGDFAQTNNCGTSLAASASCQISVTFTPTATATRTGTLTITSDAATSPNTIALTGTGIVGPVVSLSPTSVSFTGNPLNLDCPSKDVTVTNAGDQPLTVAISIAPAQFTQTNTCGTSLAPGTSCTISVKFHPTVVGTVPGTLTITTNAPDSPHTVALSGTGTPTCQLLTTVRSATVLRGTDATSFGISDASPSCSPVPIQLNCRLESPASCALSPATIPPSGSSTLQVSNLRAVAAELVTVVVEAVSEFRRTSESLLVLISDFAFTRAPERATVRAGEATSYALAVRSVNGLQGTVQLSCSGAPQGTRCTVTPATVTLDGSRLGQATVRVETTARAQAGPGRQWRPPVGPLRGLPLLLGLMSLVGLATLAARRRRVWLALSMSLLLMLVWVACGGGGFMLTSSGGGTPAGTYALTITGSYSSPSGGAALVHGTTVTLTVN